MCAVRIPPHWSVRCLSLLVPCITSCILSKSLVGQICKERTPVSALIDLFLHVYYHRDQNSAKCTRPLLTLFTRRLFGLIVESVIQPDTHSHSIYLYAQKIYMAHICLTQGPSFLSCHHAPACISIQRHIIESMRSLISEDAVDIMYSMYMVLPLLEMLGLTSENTRARVLGFTQL
ncbi:hypothetical protein BCR43DRAFT_498743 [Syncephalastrum racemosum]|uniref:Uncharacterized protein n=1 Tax=Syncephalastrum racemosum TaxID=13706 RepID=A0A1X2H1E1_SYNRA|nr:hypothetical protein BCR43DRAFT_498743 [Syncephalastrum racemosum]